MRKFLPLLLVILTLLSSACAKEGSEQEGASPSRPAAGRAYLFSEPETAVLVEWTENEGDLLGNLTVALSNVAGGHVEQSVTPLEGFTSDRGEVGLKLGKGVEANLTGRVRGDELTLAGSFGLVDRQQITFEAAEPGDWEQAVATIQESVDAALAAEQERTEAAAVRELEPTDDELGDPYVDSEGESRRFDAEVTNIEGRASAAERAVSGVQAAANVDPMTQLQVSQARAAVTVVELAAADARAAMERLEMQYEELESLLLDIALQPFTRRLEDAQRLTARADTAVDTAKSVLEHAERRSS